MKKIIFLVSLIFSTGMIAVAQPGKKPPPKEKPPTQKEMAEMMKEMQNAIDEMSPEDKKMMDSMGIKMPDTKSMQKNISGISDAQIKKAFEDESRIVPIKDAIRIAAIPKPVTDSKMGAYITAIQNKFESIFKPEVLSQGKEVYDYIKSNSKNPGEAGNMAMGLWLAGQPEIAVYVLGKICATNATNSDNLNNYSAMLSMLGAQHLAIPILNNLNAKFRKNSTVLNNLGQAWFGLGEIAKSEKYLDSAIRIYAYHPQANLTKSLIEESKGNKQQAIEAAKRSIAKAHTVEKENRLNKLGYKLQPKDLAWDRPMPQDALGLEKFKWPEYPMNVEESVILEAEWDAFRKRCKEEIDKLNIQEKVLSKEVEQANNIRTKQLLQAGYIGKIVEPLPRFAYKAMAKFNYLITDKDGHLAFSYQKKGEAISNAIKEAGRLDDILSNQLKLLEEKYEDQFGEGKPNPFNAACADDTKAKNNFLMSSNSNLREAYNDFLALMRRKINNETYYYQYTMWPETFELAKVQAKISWLSLITSQIPRFKDKSGWCRDKTDVVAKPYKLANFDDIACQYTSSLNLGCLKMETNCGNTTTTYGCGKVQFKEKELGEKYIGGTLKLSPKIGIGESEGPLTVDGSIGADLTIELDENNSVKEWKAKVTAGIEASVGVTKGPVKAGATASEALEIEIDNTGIVDVNIVTSAKIEVGVTAPKSDGKEIIDEQINKGVGYVNKGIGKLNTKVEIGVESRSSLVSHHGSVNGLGALSGAKLSEW